MNGKEGKEPVNRPPRREAKVVYLDNGRERVLRGKIEGEDGDFIRLRRRDGEVRLAKQIVLRIESWMDDSNERR